MQFAIACKDGNASIWCEQNSVLPDGRITFIVINGDWTGIYDPQKHEIYVDYTKETIYGKLIWQGKAPFYSHDYNSALRWIDEQVSLTSGRIRDWIYVDDDVAEQIKTGETNR